MIREKWITLFGVIMAFPSEPSKYEILHQIGQGTFSRIYMARCTLNSRMVAIRKIDLERNQIDIEHVHHEIANWCVGDDPHLVHYYVSFLEGTILWVVTEYMDGGSCLDILHFAYSSGFKDEVLIASILQSVLQFLLYFHEKNQIHRDIRPKNILLDTNGNVRVGNLGLAANLIEAGQRKRARFTVVGTPCYTAPEVLNTEIGYTTSADIWSVGMTAIELATGATPYDKLPAVEQIRVILTEKPPQLPSGFSPQFKDFILSCLNRNPDKRPTAATLLSHKFIKMSKGQNYIASNLMMQLPPLFQRFTLTHPPDNDTPPTPKKSPPIFNFAVNEGDPNGEEIVKKIGRFTFSVKNSPSSEILDEMERRGQNPMASMKSDISDITHRVDILEQDYNDSLKQIREMSNCVKKLLAAKKAK